MGSQLQFLAALGKAATDFNDTNLLTDVISAYEYRVENLWSQRTNKDLAIISGTNAIGRSGPAWSMLMIGLLLSKGNGFYNYLNNSPKIHLDALIERIVPSQIDSLLYNSTIKASLDAPYGGRTFYEDDSGEPFPVAPYSINGAALVAGVLGMYSNFVWRPNNPGKVETDYPNRSLLSNIINKIKDRYTKYDSSNRALISIGGRSNARKICTSSGYNSLVAMGSSLAAHGTVWTTGMQVPTSAFVAYARNLNAQFEYSLIGDNKAYELGRPFDFTGSKMTYEEYVNNANKYGLIINEEDNPCTEEDDSDFGLYFSGDEGVGLHTEPTVYLYTSTWTGDAEFIYAVDKALRNSGEIGSFTGMSVLRASLREGINEGSSHRALTGFAGALSSGVIEVSDGLI